MIKWRYMTTPSSLRGRGWSVLSKFPLFTPIPPPPEVTIILNYVTIIHLLFFIVLQMYVSYTRYCLVFFAWLSRNGIILCIFLCDLLLSFKMMFLRFIHLMCSHRYFQFGRSFTKLFVYYFNTKQTQLYPLSHQLSLHSYIQQCMAIPQVIYIWFGLVPSFCYINSAAMNITELISWYTCAKVYPGKAPKRGTAGPRAQECPALSDNAHCFPKWLEWFILLSPINKCSSCFQSYPIFDIVCLLKFCQSGRYKMEFHWDFYFLFTWAIIFFYHIGRCNPMIKWDSAVHSKFSH